MSKQSSVEWLAEEFANHIEEIYGMKITNLNLLVKAKAMHKAETCQFAVDWFQNCPIGGDVNSTEDATQYYKETFNT